MLVVLFPKVPPPLLILALDAHDPQNHATSEMHIFFKSGKAMSALDQKQTSRLVRAMSALPPKADMAYQGWNVRFVPKGDSCGGSKKLFDDLVGKWGCAARAQPAIVKRECPLWVISGY
jgi:hypothetical protein